MNGIGQRIRKARENKSLTQEQLAEYVGVSRTAVSKWEKEESEPSLAHLTVLSELLGTTTDNLLGLQAPQTMVYSLSEETMEALNRFIEAILKNEIRKENSNGRMDNSQM